MDIHPANPGSNDLQDHRDTTFGYTAFNTSEAFQKAANDPQVSIPANAGIRLVEAWSQQPLVAAFGSSRKNYTMNLWGQSQATGLLSNSSGVDIHWHNITNHPGQAPFFYPPVLYPVRHEQVHQYYEDVFVLKGLVEVGRESPSTTTHLR